MSLSDAERPLNRRGERDAPKMGERLSARGFKADLLVSSPAVRAWTTAGIIASKLDYPREAILREPSLYLASPDEILDVIATQDDDVQSLVLFGHNPGFTMMANLLVPGITNNVPTTGIVSVSVDSPTWALYDQPPTELAFFDYPKKIQAH